MKALYFIEATYRHAVRVGLFMTADVCLIMNLNLEVQTFLRFQDILPVSELRLLLAALICLYLCAVGIYNYFTTILREAGHETPVLALSCHYISIYSFGDGASLDLSLWFGPPQFLPGY